jgi:hypothetical protein
LDELLAAFDGLDDREVAGWPGFGVTEVDPDGPGDGSSVSCGSADDDWLDAGAEELDDEDDEEEDDEDEDDELDDEEEEDDELDELDDEEPGFVGSPTFVAGNGRAAP